jgi:hypothetical protein
MQLTSENLSSHNYCLYFQAIIKREECWSLTAALRSFEHLAFDRTLDKEQSLMEFFVPENCELIFLEIMTYFMQRGIVFNLQKLPNRLY